MNASCILFSDSYKDSHISELSKFRTLASIPFGGRYRLIDFILSSLVKANVDEIGVITRNKYGSLMDHIGWGKDWDLNRKNGGLKILTPFARDANVRFSDSKIEALSSIRGFLENCLSDYIILSDCNYVCNVDFNDILKCHINKKADITIVYRDSTEIKDSMKISCDPFGKVTDATFVDKDSDERCESAMGIYILKKELLFSLIDKGVTYGLHDLEREIIAKNINKMNIYAYKQLGYSAVVTTVEEYYKANMDLLNPNVRNQLINGETTILTKTSDSVPTRYKMTGNAKNSLFADGCVIGGNVINSIVFSDVKIGEGAVIKNSILMKGTVVGTDAVLENVICDKQVVINNNVELRGSKNYPFVIEKSRVI